MTIIEVPVSGSPRPALVDHWNAWVRRHSWCTTVGGTYVHTRLNTHETIYLHQLIVSPPPGLTVDHIDHDPFNNVEANLRLATKQQQLHNQGLRRDSTSGFKGVSYMRSGQRRKRWIAQIMTPDGRHPMRYFATPEEAAEQYDRWAIEHFREFACTNRSLGLI